MEKQESKILVKDRELVIPGDVLAQGLDYLPSAGCYRENENLKSKSLGLVRLKDRLVGVIPISGIYTPKPGDGVIAKVIDMQSSFWICNLNSPYDALLQLGEAVSEYVDTRKTDISTYFDIGDVIYAKINTVTKMKHVTLTMNDRRAKKLLGGRMMKITPSKVPRLIGREGSMIELIKEKTGCQIVVGQNGVVWLRGEDEALAARSIEMIEAEAHTSGLTDRITKFLEGEKNGN